MRFEDLYKNLLDMTTDERIEFFSNYCEKRKNDLAEIAVRLSSTPRASKKPVKDKKVTVTNAQLDILKKLGLI